MAREKVSLATLGSREEVFKEKITVSVTAGADTTSTEALTFDKEFVNTPEILSVDSVDSGLIKGNIGVHTVSTTGLTAYIYQVLAGDVASGDYVVEVTLVGKRVA